MTKSVKHPCQGCIYFKACGENTRTEPCGGRKTRREAKQEMFTKPSPNHHTIKYNKE